LEHGPAHGAAAAGNAAASANESFDVTARNFIELAEKLA
jgi:hypothetical protein